MWVYTTKGFYSIVKDETHSGNLLVRSRFHGDIEKLIPDAKVIVTLARDYLYRASVPKATVAAALIQNVLDIDYPNFKDAVLDDDRHEAYGEVWATMYHAGLGSLHKRKLPSLRDPTRKRLIERYENLLSRREK
jgi:hypothetical protein